jgi:hypothetical protein
MNDISIIDYKESLKSVSTVFWTFLEEGKPLTAGCCSLREEKELVWAFLPPSAFFAPGERTGKFRFWSAPAGIAGFRWKTLRLRWWTKWKHRSTHG